MALSTLAALPPPDEVDGLTDEVAVLLGDHGLRHGVQRRIAEELGVSPATISRDVKALLYTRVCCPTCRAIYSPAEWEARQAPVGTFWEIT